MKLILQMKRAEGNAVLTFRFQPTEPVTWQAGQSIRLELPVGYDTEERRFTISSAPFERWIDITTRMSQSRFKQALLGLKLGAVIDAYAVEGDFLWQDTSHQLIFAASGLGITPFLAILKQRDYEAKPMPVTLIYADRQAVLFEAFLRDLQVRHPDFTVVFLPHQRLSTDRILSHSPVPEQTQVYLAGPSSMIDELGAQLIEAGLPEMQLKRDWFTGYQF